MVDSWNPPEIYKPTLHKTQILQRYRGLTTPPARFSGNLMEKKSSSILHPAKLRQLLKLTFELAIDTLTVSAKPRNSWASPSSAVSRLFFPGISYYDITMGW